MEVATASPRDREAQGHGYQRVELPRRSLMDSLMLRQQQFLHQFSNIYRLRLAKLRPLLRPLAQQKWGASISIAPQLIDSEFHPEEVVEIVIVGNVFKELKLRPSVLAEYRLTGEVGEFNEIFENYHSESDSIYLEDESGRIRLVGYSTFLATVVTGITLALKGRVLAGGEFEVHDHCFLYQSLPPSPTLCQDTSNSRYLLLVSGVEFGAVLTSSPGAPPLEMSTQLLADFISGRLGDPQEMLLASKISRVILAGNSVTSVNPEVFKERHLTQAQQQLINSPTRQLDQFLTQILGSCAVDLIPGPLDPTNSSLPQQPWNPCLLPSAVRFSSFNAFTNPYLSSLTLSSEKEVLVFGHAGEPVDDIRRQTRCEENLQEMREPIDILCDSLLWGHLCPTAPDTIPAFPFTDDDPFIIAPSTEERQPPMILFAGNQDKFSSKLLAVSYFPESTPAPLLAICIPKFSITREAVLVDLDSFQCRVLSFGI